MDGRGASEHRRPTRQRRLALLVLLAAVALAVAAYPLRTRWWGGLVLAVAEAGIVGGLADWFAVTALFRHPLGLPIPHTAIIPANWELMARRVGSMVGDRVLTKDYVGHEIERFDIAELLARGGRARQARRPRSAGRRDRALGDGAGHAHGDRRRRGLAELAWPARTPSRRCSPPASRSRASRAGISGSSRRRTAALIDALERPDFRATVGDLVDEVLADYRTRMGVYPRILMGLASTFGLIDRGRHRHRAPPGR